MSYEILKKMQQANKRTADTLEYGRDGIWDFPEMTDATRKAAREHFANLMNKNVEQLLSGNVGYRDREVFARLKKNKQEYLDGKRDHTLVFVQWAVFHQTGKYHPILP
jgi:hypothetical protein